MRALTALITILAPASVFASGGGLYDSGVFVWLFFGLCTMIFTIQTIPSVLLVVGMVKGFSSVIKQGMAPAAQ